MPTVTYLAEAGRPPEHVEAETMTVEAVMSCCGRRSGQLGRDEQSAPLSALPTSPSFP